MADSIKVAILGGGCGAMSAAFWLTDPALGGKFEVTVYTQGWRLGGKGASGRCGKEHLIEEHGLHMMMGCYEHTFQVIKACYAQMPHLPDDAFTQWEHAFQRQYLITLWLRSPSSSRWEPVNLEFPPLPGTPAVTPSTSADYMHEGVNEVLDRLVNSVLRNLDQRLVGIADWTAELREKVEQCTDDLVRAKSAQYGVAAQRQALVKVLRRLQYLFKHAIAPWLKKVRYVDYLFIDLAIAGVIGFLTDVMPRGEAGYERINGRDLKDWLVEHEADREAAESPVIMWVYDLAFAYHDGDSSVPRNGQAAAGALLRMIIRIAFTYKGAPLWKMNGGMSDIIFTPLYWTLLGRGVRFEFFHRVTALHLRGDEIASIDLDRQARLAGGRAFYDPLVRVKFASGKSWDCWPSQPRWEQIEKPDETVDFEDPWTAVKVESRTLKRGHEFHLVVLAIPPAAAAFITAELRSRYREWRDMIDNSRSVATLSGQLWLKPELQALGWPYGPTVGICYEDPLRSWGEMSHVLPYENGSAQSCEYLCGTLARPPAAPPYGSHDPRYLKLVSAQVERDANAWLGVNTGALWPGVADASGSLDRRQLVSAYYRANVAYSELYVQTPPGSVASRLAPDWCGAKNLYVAGDWTRTSINGGCAEAAFESGWLAARAMLAK